MAGTYIDTTKLLEELIFDITHLDPYELIDLHNMSCDFQGGCWSDWKIYDMVDFDDRYEHLTPTQIAKKIQNGHFNVEDNYFWVDANARLCSGNFPDETDSPISPLSIAEWVITTGNAHGCDSIADSLKRWKIKDGDDEDEEDTEE